MNNYSNTYFIIDFDSTFVTVEALDELAKIALQDKPEKLSLISQISQITQLGMEGKITFPESLATRLSLFQANQVHVKKLILLLKKHITHSIEQNKQFFQNNADQIYIISGGFKEYIYPVVKDFGIKQNHVLANIFIFDDKGNIIGFDPTNPLSQENGKVKVVRSMNLKNSLLSEGMYRNESDWYVPQSKGQIYVIGDGYTDYQIKQHGYADKFFAFTENISRPSVVANADSILDSFHTFLQLHHEAI